MTHPSTVADTLDAGHTFGVWQDIASAPRDGTGMLLTDGRWVHYGWWRGEGSHPWVMVDSHDTEPHGCCDSEAVDTIQLNGWTEAGPTRWMPMPDLPAKARGEVQP